MTGIVDLVVLEDSYHMITLDKERHLVVDYTKAFLARNTGTETETKGLNQAA